MTKAELTAQIRYKASYLCVGLDTDPKLLPAFLKKEADPVFAFNRAIIDATASFAVAYKPNLAFYEAQGPQGWESLQRTLAYIPKDCFTIADAKRGDLGNTAACYARTFFDPAAAGFDFDSVTLSPLMGHDSVEPFLAYKGKWAILLALTSNAGSADFQNLRLEGGEQLFERILKTSTQWGSPENLMYVVGATRADRLAHIRTLVPGHFLLVPGVGAQGGSLAEVSAAGLTPEGGLLVNASRSILYAASGHDFAAAAGAEARRLQQQMAQHLYAI